MKQTKSKQTMTWSGVNFIFCCYRLIPQIHEIIYLGRKLDTKPFMTNIRNLISLTLTRLTMRLKIEMSLRLNWSASVVTSIDWA